MPTAVNTYQIPVAPAVPDRTNRTTFPTNAFNWYTWMHDSLYANMNQLATITYSNALEAAAAATVKNLGTFKGVYAAGTSYALGESVFSGGLFYISNVNANLGNAPATSPTQWSLVGGTKKVGGLTVNASTALTAGSGPNIKFTTTGFGQYVQLPDATLCQLDAEIFRIHNYGPFDLKVLDAAGVIRGFVPPFSDITVGLVDASTAAGGWLMNDAALLGVTAELGLSSLSAGTGAGGVVAVPLDSNRTMVIAGDTTAYAVVYDASTQTWGTAVSVSAVVTGSGKFSACLLAANTVLFTGASALTVLTARVLTVAGSVITVGAATTQTALTSGFNFGTPVAFNAGASAVLGVINGNTSSIYPFGIVGSTITIGAPTTGTGASSNNTIAIPHVYAINATDGVAFMTNAAGTAGSAQPFTIATSVLTAGTATAIAGANSFYDVRSLAVASNTFAVLWTTTAPTSGVDVVVVTGNVATRTSRAAVFGTGIGISPSAGCDMMWLGGTKVLVTATVSSIPYFNIIDTSAGQGTPVTGQTVTGLGVVAIMQGSLASNVVHAVAAATSCVRTYALDCSGASPVLTEHLINGAQDVSLSSRSIQRGCTRDPLTMRIGVGALPIPVWSSGAFNKRNQSLAAIGARAFAYTQDITAMSAIGAVGGGNGDTWLKGDQSSGVGQGAIFLQRVEAAQP